MILCEEVMHVNSTEITQPPLNDNVEHPLVFVSQMEDWTGEYLISTQFYLRRQEYNIA